MAGPIWNGISTAEIESVARVAEIPLTAGLLDNVRVMETEASRILNAKESG